MTEKQSEKSKVDKKKESILDAHQVYTLKEGLEVPGVTTIVPVFEPWGMVHKAWQLGRSGKNYKEVWRQKRQTGTLAHYLVVCHLKGEEPELDEFTKAEIDLAENCMLSYLEWERVHPFEVVLIETPLVSHKHKFGGKLDLLVKINGCNELTDLKTGSGIFLEHEVQLAAYWILLEENGYKVDRATILNIPRSEDENFDAKQKTNLTNEKKVFLDCLKLYNDLKKVRARRP